jgi:hypothetical protein
VAKIAWNGNAVKQRVAASARMAVDKVAADCVSGAKRGHPWENQTGFEESEIHMAPATLEGKRVVGRWGAFTDYSLALEIGTSRIGPTIYDREAASDGMWTIAPPQPAPGVTVEQAFTILPPGTMNAQEGFVTVHQPSHGTGPLMSSRPFLRPQADMHYPLLARYIATLYQGGQV